MGCKLVIAVLAAYSLAPGRVAPIAAQSRLPVVPIPFPTPLHAIALNDLSFGTVLPGIPSSVSVRDARHAGLFEIRGAADAAVRVEFVLPAALTAHDGALLPVTFGRTDGLADFSRGHPPRALVFDPNAPFIGSLGPNGSLFLRMGGTVIPGRPQTGGAYRATISMTVYDLGS